METAETGLRAEIVAQARWMNAAGLNQGTSGNLSARLGAEMLVTPSSVAYDAMTVEMVAKGPVAGPPAWEGPCQPSSEWRMHRDILAARPEFGAVVHTHATFCTVLSMRRAPIPAFHYMIALFGGADVRCADYATFGTEALSANALAALADRNACLLANHGMLACGPTLAKAMALAVELETLARQTYHALLLGGAVRLTDPEIARTAEAMQSLPSYGAGS